MGFDGQRVLGLGYWSSSVLTNQERAWLDDIVEMGCIVCKQDWIYSPAEVHHILKSGRRQTHMETIPLCYVHHRGGMNNEIAVSRHPHKRAFEKRYGTEAELYESCKQLQS